MRDVIFYRPFTSGWFFINQVIIQCPDNFTDNKVLAFKPVVNRGVNIHFIS